MPSWKMDPDQRTDFLKCKLAVLSAHLVSPVPAPRVVELKPMELDLEQGSRRAPWE